jgi:NADPH-dependent 2,4-dienoyl-CoA reductase/sulfur reductase-like enzyme
MTPATVIVGASVAGVATARELRAAGYDGEITLVGDEPTLPYDRPPLSKALLAGSATAESVTLLTEAGARDLGVRLLLGQAARHLDVGGGLVELAGGQRLRYDDVVIATGARARRSPWGEPPGLHHLRTLGEAEALRDDLRGGGPLVVIGAGLIGAEVAATARQLGVAEVTLVDPAPVPMGRVIDPETAARLGDRHREHGVTTRFGTKVESVTREPGGLAVRTSDGAVLPAATVVVGIGAVANDDWLASSGLTTGGGLHCDGHCRALGAPRVHAVGDVARWWHAGRGALVRAEHWTNAIEQARYVAADITRPGWQGPYQPAGYVWSDQYGATIQVIGQADQAARRVTVERPATPGAFAVLYATCDGMFAGAVTVAWPKAALAARRAVAAGTPLDTVHAALTTSLQPALSPPRHG